MFANSFPDRAEMAKLTARMLWEVEAVHFRPDEPYIFTSGLASPVYIDCRKLISFPRVRSALMDFQVATLYRDVGVEQFDAVAGGETAGIPFAAFIAERMGIRDTGAHCAHTCVLFYYDIFKGGLETLSQNGLTLHYLATWWDVLAEARAAGLYDEQTTAAVEAFLNAPLEWSGAHGGVTEVVAS